MVEDGEDGLWKIGGRSVSQQTRHGLKTACIILLLGIAIGLSWMTEMMRISFDLFVTKQPRWMSCLLAKGGGGIDRHRTWGWMLTVSGAMLDWRPAFECVKGRARCMKRSVAAAAILGNMCRAIGRSRSRSIAYERRRRLAKRGRMEEEGFTFQSGSFFFWVLSRCPPS